MQGLKGVGHTKGVSNFFSIPKNKYDSNTKNHEGVICFWGVNLALIAGGCMHDLDPREIIQYHRLFNDRKGG